MQSKIINLSFFAQDAEALAEKFLGIFLCRRLPDGTVLKKRITEVEIYKQNDSACHAYKGKTKRNSMMFAAGGHAYVYLCYGLFNLLNIVSGQEGDAQAVLIRGIQGFDGPGRVSRALQIDRSLNGELLWQSDKLWLEEDGLNYDFIKLPRVGIAYAKEEDRSRLWRYRANHL